MRVNVDDPHNDPRVRHLARLAGGGIHDAVGRLLAVWRTAYMNRSPWMLPLDIDASADMDAFGEKMVTARLASLEPSPDEEGIPPATTFEATRAPSALWIRGVRGRILHLLSASEKGRKSAEARRAARSRSAAQDEPVFNTGSTGVQPRSNTSSTPVQPVLNTSSTSGSGSGSRREDLSGEDLNTRGSPPNTAPEFSPLRASGAGAGNGARNQRDPREISNLAAVEADLEAHGKPIPWRDDPRRWAMTHDVVGKPVQKLGPRNGSHR